MNVPELVPGGTGMGLLMLFIRFVSVGAFFFSSSSDVEVSESLAAPYADRAAKLLPTPGRQGVSMLFYRECISLVVFSEDYISL